MTSSIQAGFSVPALALKLIPPSTPADMVVRDDIGRQLRAAHAAQLVLLSAPAGFGKSTVMACYLAQLGEQGMATGWLTLDDADNDVERFLLKLDSALTRAGIDGALPEPAPQAGVLSTGARLDVVGRLAAIERPFVLFFDDFEVLHNPVVLDLFRSALEHLPPLGRIVIGTREHSRLNLARWRASGRMVELGPANFRFTITEAGELLRRRSHLSLSKVVIEQLFQRTEGWVTALHLAALSLANHPNPKQFALAFSGTNAAVADYLLETVLDAQPAPLRDFLLATSVLDEFNADACNALTGRDDGQQVLESLERSNVFLTPIDGNRRRYRYHALFAVFLRSELQRRRPDEIRHLHQAACDWYLREGRPEPAIGHAQASGDVALCTRLLHVHAERLLLEGRFRLLARWFDALPPGALVDHPMLTLVYAWALSCTRREQEAIRLLDSIDNEVRGNAPGMDAPPVIAWAGALRGLTLAMMDRTDECSLACQRDYQIMPQVALLPHGVLANTLAYCFINEARYDEALAVLAEAKRTHALTNSVFNMAIAECVHGVLELVHGRLRDATARLRVALASVAKNRYRAIGGGATLGVYLASALYEGNQLDAAEDLLAECLPLVKEAGTPDAIIINHLFLARIARAAGDAAQASQRLADLELIGHACSLPRLVASVWLERAKWALNDLDFHGAEDYLRQAGSFENVWQLSARFPVNSNDIDDLALGHLRLLVRAGRHGAALQDLKTEIARADASNRRRRASLLRLLQVEAFIAEGQSRVAMRQLEELLLWGCAEGFVRIFVDEGPVVGKLVADYRQHSNIDSSRPPALLAYVDQLLMAFGLEHQIVPADASGAPREPVEPLSGREIQVLRMLDLGYSNKAIGERLFISGNTVKAHLRNINTKLGVGSRSQATAAARRLGLVRTR